MASAVAELSSLFPRPWLRFEQGPGGLIKAVVQTSAASGEVYLHGAHVSHWQPSGHEPVLWMSRASHFETGKPIRGGVPICFPWFGPHPSDPSAPAHGFARITEWRLVSADELEDDFVQLSFTTTIDSFELRFGVAFGSALRMRLETRLSPDAKGSTTFEQALHTYFAVCDVRSVSVSGLEEAAFIDKVDRAAVKPATGLPIAFSGETDRVYLNTVADCHLKDTLRNRVIRVRKSGSSSTVVWNPWISKSIRMPDFGDHEWPEMVCIESANVGDSRVDLLPGQSHSLNVEISVVSADDCRDLFLQ